MLVASALPFAAIGAVGLLAPDALARRAGIGLGGATADADFRAIYGGLQLACAALLGLCAREPARLRAGLVAQLVLYGNLAFARLMAWTQSGAPGALGVGLLAAECSAIGAGAIALATLRGRRGSVKNDGIHRAGPRDLEQLLPLCAAFQKEEGYESDEASLRAALAELLAGDEVGCILLALESARAVGYAALCFGYSIEFRGRDAFVDELYVAPDRRSQGLGRALLRALESEARTAGVRQLHLEVELANAGARSLYLEEGFRPTARELLTKPLG